jgi:hypothetical protein
MVMSVSAELRVGARSLGSLIPAVQWPALLWHHNGLRLGPIEDTVMYYSP